MCYIYCCLNDEGEEKVHKILKCFFFSQGLQLETLLAPVKFFSLPSKDNRQRDTRFQLLFYLLISRPAECAGSFIA